MFLVKEDEIKIYDLECVREDGNESSVSINFVSIRLFVVVFCDKFVLILLNENLEKLSIRGNWYCDRGV